MPGAPLRVLLLVLLPLPLGRELSIAPRLPVGHRCGLVAVLPLSLGELPGAIEIAAGVVGLSLGFRLGKYAAAAIVDHRKASLIVAVGIAGSRTRYGSSEPGS